MNKCFLIFVSESLGFPVFDDVPEDWPVIEGWTSKRLSLDEFAERLHKAWSGCQNVTQNYINFEEKRTIHCDVCGVTKDASSWVFTPDRIISCPDCFVSFCQLSFVEQNKILERDYLFQFGNDWNVYGIIGETYGPRPFKGNTTGGYLHEIVEDYSFGLDNDATDEEDAAEVLSSIGSEPSSPAEMDCTPIGNYYDLAPMIDDIADSFTGISNQLHNAARRANVAARHLIEIEATTEEKRKDAGIWEECVDKLQKLESTLSTRCKNLETKQAFLTEETAKLENEVEEKKKEAESVTREALIQRYEDKLRVLSAETKKGRNALTKQREKLDKLKNSEKTMMSTNADLTKTEKAKKTEIEKLTNEIEKALMTMNETKKNIEALLGEEIELKDLSMKKQEYKKKTKEEIDTANKEISALRNLIHERKSEIESLEADVFGLKKQKSQIEDEVSAFTEEKKRFEWEKEIYYNSKNECQEAMEKMQKDLELLSGTFEWLGRSKAQLEQEVDELATKKRQLEEEVDDMSKTVEAVSGLLSRKKARID